MAVDWNGNVWQPPQSLPLCHVSDAKGDFKNEKK